MALTVRGEDNAVSRVTDLARRGACVSPRRRPPLRLKARRNGEQAAVFLGDVHRRLSVVVVACCLLGASAMPADTDSGTALAALYRRDVARRLDLPADEQVNYARLLAGTLAERGLGSLPAQYVVVVDRSVFVQAVMIFWKSETGSFEFIGASPTSTGKPGRVEHFETPLGVFPHSLENLDFRAEGTRNELGIRGYGRKGLRVYDFGWVSVPKGWGNRQQSIMRLQMHATDPDRLEPRLGSVQSQGCIRIPASLDTFVDRFGILDAAYERAQRAGRVFWVLSPEREPTPWSGEYLVVVDTARGQRPAWSPAPTF